MNNYQKYFWRWISFSILALFLVAAVPAFSADVFIDEGDGDSPTPVTSAVSKSPAPASVAVAVQPPANVGKKPASEDSTPSTLDADLAQAVSQLDSGSNEGEAGKPVDDMSMPPADAPPAAPVAEPKAAATPKPSKMSIKEKYAIKKPKSSKSKSSKKKKTDKKSSKKKSKKKSTPAKGSKKSKKKKSSVADVASSKRKVASNVSYAGGQYQITSKDCAMESSPGAGDKVGTSRAGRKLWVEDSGNTSYWKVYGKTGQAAFVPRECF